MDCQKQSPIAGLPLKLTDTRGPFTFSVYADADSSATCITGPSFTSVSGSMASAPFEVPAGHILLSSSHVTNRAGAYSFAEGRTGDGVRAVTLNLDDGSEVQATVANGWFVAWWPSAHVVTSADVTTPAGVSTQTLAPGGARPGPRQWFQRRLLGRRRRRRRGVQRERLDRLQPLAMTRSGLLVGSAPSLSDRRGRDCRGRLREQREPQRVDQHCR
jgi:hypothetical protein